MEGFLECVHATFRCASGEKREDNGLTVNETKVLMKVGMEAGCSLCSVYESLAMHPAVGKRAVSKLEARGMLRLHRVARNGRGGQPVVVEVLEPGAVELKKRGVELSRKRVGRGGFKHNLYGVWVWQWVRSQGLQWRGFEVVFGVKAFDGAYLNEGGGLVGVEVCLSGSVEWNVSQLQKAAAIPGVQEVLAVMDSRSLMTKVEARLGGSAELFGAGAVKCRYAGEFSPF